MFFVYKDPQYEMSRVLTLLNDLDFSPVETLPQQQCCLILLPADCEKPAAYDSEYHVIISRAPNSDADIWIEPEDSHQRLAQSMGTAIQLLNHRAQNHALRSQLGQEKEDLVQLTDIGIALSAEKNLEKLLTLILSEGRDFASCDAASLFLIGSGEQEEGELLFKLTQNDSIMFPFQEQRFALDRGSIAGYVALTGEELNLEDVYHAPEDATWKFNSSFDQEMGYRTRSMLVIPMKNHSGEVTGVLQFINRKRNPKVKLTDEETTLRETIAFSPKIAALLRALASQAAVAIDNSRLLANIERLFEGFVSASVTAIEQRDPTTSGHSFRVAELTTKLAQNLPRSNFAKFRNLIYNEEELRELRYASLLHDFGKVGVREHVLVKANKLPEHTMEIIWFRFQLLKETMQRKAVEEELAWVREHGPDSWPRADRQAALAKEMAKLDVYFNDILNANQPSILTSGVFSHLDRIQGREAFQTGGRDIKLLTEKEFLTLSIRKGSLTHEERREIESHVVHTFNFLTRIPWTANLRKVPHLAVAHHEKLNGSGYPYGLESEDIPLGAKMMTISDIFDALTASDRPYKTAMPPERACSILETEAKGGLLDSDMVQVFIESKLFLAVDPNFGKTNGSKNSSYNRSVCESEVEHLH